jgi:transposase
LEDRIPDRHLLRRINPTVTQILTHLRDKLGPFYSEMGRPSVDPKLMIRMLIVAYCYGIRTSFRSGRRGVRRELGTTGRQHHRVRYF